MIGTILAQFYLDFRLFNSNYSRIMLQSLGHLTTAGCHISNCAKKTKQIYQQLFEELRMLRKSIAQEKGLPAYIIFHDATLKEMSSSKPKSAEEMMEIQGLGEAKFRNYGQMFLDVIQLFEPEEAVVKKKKGDTFDETWELVQNGLSAEEISIAKEIALQTVYSHFVKLKTDGKDIDLSELINETEIERVKQAFKELDKPDTLKPIFEHLNGEIEYFKIKVALVL